MIAIFHANPPDFMASRPPTTKYVHVAEVATDDLEVAYMLTNTGHQYWWLNKDVTKTFSGLGCRSTSVGDMAILNGVTYLCKSCGWEVQTASVPSPEEV